MNPLFISNHFKIGIAQHATASGAIYQKKANNKNGGNKMTEHKK